MDKTSSKPLKDDSSTCYKGHHKRDWIEVVQKLQSINNTILPKIFEKCPLHSNNITGPPFGSPYGYCEHEDCSGTLFIKDSFPIIPNFSYEDLSDAFIAVEFCNKESSNIDFTKANPTENRALDTLHSLTIALKAIHQRKKSYK